MPFDPEKHQRQAEETVSFLQRELPELPHIIIVLGTGLGELTEQLEIKAAMDYSEIPHFPRSTVCSHAGRLVCGSLEGKKVAVLQGRFHYYEGYSTRELTFPVRALALLGAATLVVSNAAGGLNPDFAAGTLMVLRDHLNFIGDNPLRGPNIEAWGPRFPDLSAAYDPILREKALACAARLGLDKVTTGTYVAIPGPSLETPAETRFLRSCGADAVGMSTVPEVIVAKHAGLRVLGISVVSNLNDPDNLQPILLEDIIEQTRAAAADFQRLLRAVVAEI